jgi:two-component system response regulator CpxR
MRSIAIFPCSYTYGASVIGELSNQLRLKVYTDEMLFSDVSGQFGIPAEKVKLMICGRMPALNRYMLKKERYVNLLKCSLEAQTTYSPDRRLYYGLHTSLLDIKKDRVLKVLVFDDEERRVKRAMQQEGFTEKVAREHIQRHDEKVSDWTNFLVNKEAYDQSLYDVVIPLNNSNPLHIVTDIIELFKEMESSQTPFQTDTALLVLENHLHIGNQISCMG